MEIHLGEETIYLIRWLAISLTLTPDYIGQDDLRCLNFECTLNNHIILADTNKNIFCRIINHLLGLVNWPKF